MAGEFAEFVDAGFDVVAGLAFAAHDGGDVDVVLDALVVGDGLGGDIEAEFALGLHDGDPEFAFEADFAFGGPDVSDGRGGVAFGEDVGDGGHGEWRWRWKESGASEGAGARLARERKWGEG